MITKFFENIFSQGGDVIILKNADSCIFYHFEFSEVFYLVYYEMFDVSFSKILVTVMYCRIKYEFFFESVTSSLLL